AVVDADLEFLSAARVHPADSDRGPPGASEERERIIDRTSSEKKASPPATAIRRTTTAEMTRVFMTTGSATNGTSVAGPPVGEPPRPERIRPVSPTAFHRASVRP